MANVTEEPMPSETARLIRGSSRDGLVALGLDEAANPQTIVDAIDAFVDAWQEGKRPSTDVLDPEVAHLAMGSLWGEQMVRQFQWEWAFVVFHDHNNSRAPGVLSPDRTLAVYPIHFLKGCFQDPSVDCTVALAFNLQVANKPFIGKTSPKPKDYFNLMDGVGRIVPKRGGPGDPAALSHQPLQRGAVTRIVSLIRKLLGRGAGR